MLATHILIHTRFNTFSLINQNVKHTFSNEFVWDPHDLMGTMYILTKREWIEKYVLEGKKIPRVL